MNNRDPFNLRQGNAALNILRTNVQVAAITALSASKQAITEAGATASEIADSMSFSIPRNVPNFNDPSRRWEDSAWAGSSRSRHPQGQQSAAGAVAEKFGGMFGDRKNSLPMYKDKPFDSSYGMGSRRRGFWRKKRTLVFAVVGFFLTAYWMGWLSSSETTGTKKKGGSSWSSFLIKEEKVDWNERRDHVRDAFLLSWKAYEQHAWGLLLPRRIAYLKTLSLQ